MASREFFDHVREIADVNGEPSIDYPYSDDYPVVTRNYGNLISQSIPNFGTADPDFTNCKLVSKRIGRSDRHKQTLSLRYERVPGVEKVTPSIDAETGTQVITTTQLIAASAVPNPLPTTPGTLTTYTPINVYCGYLTTQTLQNFASLAVTLENSENFTFPRLVFGVTAGLVTGLNGNARIAMFWNERAEYNAATQVQTVFAYDTEANLRSGAPSVEYSPVFQNLAYDGVFYNVSKGGVLNDAITVGPYTTGNNNPEWGYLVENAVTFGASTPSASQYVALTGAFRVVGVHYEQWKYNLWRRTTRKVKLR